MKNCITKILNNIGLGVNASITLTDSFKDSLESIIGEPCILTENEEKVSAEFSTIIIEYSVEGTRVTNINLIQKDEESRLQTVRTQEVVCE